MGKFVFIFTGGGGRGIKTKKEAHFCNCIIESNLGKVASEWLLIESHKVLFLHVHNGGKTVSRACLQGYNSVRTADTTPLLGAALSGRHVALKGDLRLSRTHSCTSSLGQLAIYRCPTTSRSPWRRTAEEGWGPRWTRPCAS